MFGSTFHQNQEASGALWNLLFDVKKFETENRKFKRLIATNGYAITIYLQKPITEPLVSETFVYSPPENVEKYETFIGIDPGKKYVVSAFSGEMNNNGKSRCVQVSTKEIRKESK